MRFVRLKQLAMIAVVAASMSSSRGASAESVAFATFGSFTAAGSDFSTGVTLTTGAHGSSVTAAYLPSMGFFSVPSVPAGVAAPARIAIGTLSITPFDFLTQPLSFNSGDRFDVTLNELDPFAAGSATLPATIDGSLSFNRTSLLGGVDSGSFTFNFQPNNSVTLTAVDGRQFLYSLENTTINVKTKVGILGTKLSTGTLYLDVSEVAAAGAANPPAATPLPATATMGLSVLALIAGYGAFVRRRVSL